MPAQAVGQVTKGESDRVGALATANYRAKAAEDDVGRGGRNGGARTTTIYSAVASEQHGTLQSIVVIAPTPVCRQSALLLAIIVKFEARLPTRNSCSVTTTNPRSAFVLSHALQVVLLH